jgi:hypothetical protein
MARMNKKIKEYEAATVASEGTSAGVLGAPIHGPPLRRKMLLSVFVRTWPNQWAKCWGNFCSHRQSHLQRRACGRVRPSIAGSTGLLDVVKGRLRALSAIFSNTDKVGRECFAFDLGIQFVALQHVIRRLSAAHVQFAAPAHPLGLMRGIGAVKRNRCPCKLTVLFVSEVPHLGHSCLSFCRLRRHCPSTSQASARHHHRHRRTR